MAYVRVYDYDPNGYVNLYRSGRSRRVNFSYLDHTGRRRWVKEVPLSYRQYDNLTTRARKFFGIGRVPPQVVLKRKPVARASFIAATDFPPLLPWSVRNALLEASTDPMLNEEMVALAERVNEYESPLACLLAGAYMNRWARALVDEKLDACVSTSVPAAMVDEVIVGGGLHAAIYSAIRVKMGKPKPLVIERNRMGGMFAMSRRSAFYLNSRNQYGPLSEPGRGALNTIPGAIVQPYDLGGEEYQTNTQLAWVIRLMLASYANVVRGEIKGISRLPNFRLVLESDAVINAKRVLGATGFASPVIPESAVGERWMTFQQFMERMDSPFPLRGMRRVAVIGAGDSGKTAIEMLTGQGPPAMTTMTLDRPEEIDWYGVPASCLTREGWEKNNRSRYKRIGKLLPLGESPDFQRVRVFPLVDKARVCGAGFETAFVNGRQYDYAIICAGFLREESFRWIAPTEAELLAGNRPAARGRNNLLLIGPAANFKREESEKLGPAQENLDSIFRYAPRTAALAALT